MKAGFEGRESRRSRARQGVRSAKGFSGFFEDKAMRALYRGVHLEGDEGGKRVKARLPHSGRGFEMRLARLRACGGTGGARRETDAVARKGVAGRLGW